MALVLDRTAELRLHSRCENQIKNEINREQRRFGDELAVDDWIQRYPNAEHRVRSSRKYNCHGLSFASRRTWIKDPEEIAKILRDDDYSEIPLAEIKPGDFAIYWKDGDYEHSGIVVEVAENPKMAKILGKWGFCHEVIHWANDSPYSGEIKYYRVMS